MLHAIWVMLHLEDGRAVGQVRQRVGHLARELELRDPCQVAAVRRCRCRAESRVRPHWGTQYPVPSALGREFCRACVVWSEAARMREGTVAVGRWWWRCMSVQGAGSVVESSPGVVEQARHHRNI